MLITVRKAEMIIDSKKYRGICSCGQEHPMFTEIAVIESGCLYDLPSYRRLLSLDGIAVAVYDENTYHATESKHPNVEHTVVLDPSSLHADENGIAALSAQLPNNTEVIIAIGSGTIHDLVRYCAFERGIPFISCPTAASVDGFCSSVAAMTFNGCKKTFLSAPPKLVLADLEVIISAPMRMTRSGAGDMLGKYIALADWKIANILRAEAICPRIISMTYDAVNAVTNSFDGLLTHDVRAYQSLMYGLILSGLCMQMLGSSRCASGAEHHISHLIETHPSGIEGLQTNALHGEKVGVATLLVSERYHRLMKADPTQLHDYSCFSNAEIEALYGTQLADEIIIENRNDVATGIKAEHLAACLSDIAEIIHTIPTPQQLRELYKRIDMKKSLPDIGIQDDKRDVLLKYSPSVRNRLTLMRLWHSMISI